MAAARRALALGALVLTATACGGSDDGTDLSSEGVPATAGDFGPSGTLFEVASIVVDGVDQEVRTGEVLIRLNVTPTGFSLLTNCHDVIAEYTLDAEGDLTISDPRGPRYGCPEADAEQADRLVAVVGNGARWAIVDEDLVATRDDLEVTFRPSSS